jgi:hypothetical protein
MNNEQYLTVSYFGVALVSLCLGAGAYRLLRAPFGAIADLATGRLRSTLLKRALAVSLTMVGVVGFLGVSYTQNGCSNYEQVIKNRSYLVQMNREQLGAAGDSIVVVVFAWCVVVLICLVAWRRKSSATE